MRRDQWLALSWPEKKALADRRRLLVPHMMALRRQGLTMPAIIERLDLQCSREKVRQSLWKYERNLRGKLGP